MKTVSTFASLFFMYFIQGLPYGLQSNFLPIYLHSKKGISLTRIGFLKSLNSPWLLKFIWGPFIDTWGTKQKWITGTSVILSINYLCGLIIKPDNFTELALIIFSINIFTSMQDVVVDAMAVDFLKNDELAFANIAQVVGYKMGALFSGGFLASLIEIIEWKGLFFIIGLFFLGAAMFSLFSPSFYNLQDSPLENDKIIKNVKRITKENLKIVTSIAQNASHENLNSYNMYFKILFVFKTNKIWWIITFLLSYKLGEQGALTMLPLYLLQHGNSSNSITFWFNVIGQIVSIIGSISGGLVAKYYSGIIDLDKILQQLCLLRLLPIGSFLFMIIMKDALLISSEEQFKICIAMLIILLILSGFITTITFTMMMEKTQLVNKNIKATYYSLLATFEVFGKLMFITICGYLTDLYGYQIIFLLFTILSIVIFPFFKHLKNVCIETFFDDEDKLNVVSTNKID